jgi:signal transduction histidine kinase
MELLEENKDLTNKLKDVRRLEEEADIGYLLEEVPNAIDQTVKGLKDVSRLILGLKGFAHSSDNAEKTDADINQIIKNSLTVCKNSYKYVARLETDFRDIPTIKVNHGDIGQVVLNLVVNAAQAIEQVKGTSDNMGTIRITSKYDKEYVIITVSDTGGGIPEAIIGRVFDPFFTTKEVGQGSGQGLAIARNIIHEKHGGEIFIKSKPGEGTTFIVKLPFAG